MDNSELGTRTSPTTRSRCFNGARYNRDSSNLCGANVRCVNLVSMGPGLETGIPADGFAMNFGWTAELQWGPA